MQWVFQAKVKLISLQINTLVPPLLLIQTRSECTLTKNERKSSSPPIRGRVGIGSNNPNHPPAPLGIMEDQKFFFFTQKTTHCTLYTYLHLLYPVELLGNLLGRYYRTQMVQFSICPGHILQIKLSEGVMGLPVTS